MTQSNKILPVQIKKIHIAIKDIHISDRQYRDILSGFNNAQKEPCSSCKELTEKQANILLDLFKTKLGWIEKKKGKKLKYDELAGRDPKFASPGQMRKIEAEWMKYSREKTISSMNSFIFRQVKVSMIESVLKQDVNRLLKAIESLPPSPTNKNTCGRPVRRSPGEGGDEVKEEKNSV